MFLLTAASFKWSWNDLLSLHNLEKIIVVEGFVLFSWVVLVADFQLFL